MIFRLTNGNTTTRNLSVGWLGKSYIVTFRRIGRGKRWHIWRTNPYFGMSEENVKHYWIWITELGTMLVVVDLWSEVIDTKIYVAQMTTNTNRSTPSRGGNNFPSGAPENTFLCSILLTNSWASLSLFLWLLHCMSFNLCLPITHLVSF